MADEGTVTLIAPNGMQVGVAASRQVELVAAGYRLPQATPTADGPKPPARKAAAVKAAKK